MSREVEEYMKAGERRQVRWARLGAWSLGVAVALGLGVGLFLWANFVPAGDRRVLETLEAAGLRDATLGGAGMLKCEANESSRQFRARSGGGKTVEGTVCCGVTGLVKGCLIRYSP